MSVLKNFGLISVLLSLLATGCGSRTSPSTTQTPQADASAPQNNRKAAPSTSSMQKPLDSTSKAIPNTQAQSAATFPGLPNTRSEFSGLFSSVSGSYSRRRSAPSRRIRVTETRRPETKKRSVGKDDNKTEDAPGAGLALTPEGLSYTAAPPPTQPKPVSRPLLPKPTPSDPIHAPALPEPQHLSNGDIYLKPDAAKGPWDSLGWDRIPRLRAESDPCKIDPNSGECYQSEALSRESIFPLSEITSIDRSKFEAIRQTSFAETIQFVQALGINVILTGAPTYDSPCSPLMNLLPWDSTCHRSPTIMTRTSTDSSEKFHSKANPGVTHSSASKELDPETGWPKTVHIRIELAPDADRHILIHEFLHALIRNEEHAADLASVKFIREVEKFTLPSQATDLSNQQFQQVWNLLTLHHTPLAQLSDPEPSKNESLTDTAEHPFLIAFLLKEHEKKPIRDFTERDIQGEAEYGLRDISDLKNNIHFLNEEWKRISNPNSAPPDTAAGAVIHFLAGAYNAEGKLKQFQAPIAARLKKLDSEVEEAIQTLERFK
jgi:hypothetical protein